jgi:hypothetical protein
VTENEISCLKLKLSPSDCRSRKPFAFVTTKPRSNEFLVVSILQEHNRYDWCPSRDLVSSVSPLETGIASHYLSYLSSSLFSPLQQCQGDCKDRSPTHSDTFFFFFHLSGELNNQPTGRWKPTIAGDQDTVGIGELALWLT